MIFTLAISFFTTFNLPLFMDLIFQVPMKYCPLQHWTLYLPQDISHIHSWVSFLLSFHHCIGLLYVIIWHITHWQVTFIVLTSSRWWNDVNTYLHFLSKTVVIQKGQIIYIYKVKLWFRNITKTVALVVRNPPDNAGYTKDVGLTHERCRFDP